MIAIDGSYLEGGGQIIRTAIALASVTKQSVRIFNIRKGRDKPGLRPQHLEGITAASRICSGKTEGLSLNSTEVSFTPGTIRGGRYTIDTKTAGSVSLILQTLLPIGMHADCSLELTIKGGTAVPFSPTIAYLQDVYCGILKKMGVSVNIGIKRHGFYPRGGGEIYVRIDPTRIKGVDLTECGKLESIRVDSVASFHLKSAKVAERMVNGFKNIFPESVAQVRYVPTDSPGCFVNGLAIYEKSVMGADVLGRVGKRAEDVGKDAALALREMSETDAPIDIWMVDQIVPYMALAAYETREPSRIRIPKSTKHAETNTWVVEQFLPVRFCVDSNVMTCRKITP
jgi:RNA 3'-terminal phosphate cyclase (ATP)